MKEGPLLPLECNTANLVKKLASPFRKEVSGS